MSADEGWTTIKTRGPRRKTKRKQSYTTYLKDLDDLSATVPDLKKAFESAKRVFETSPFPAKFRTITPRQSLTASKIICLGLGSLQNERTRTVGLYQLCVLETCLRDAALSSAEVVHVDPAFSDVDIEFLSSLTRTTAFKDISMSKGVGDGEMLLYAPHLELSILLPFLEEHGKRIVLYVGNMLEPIVDGPLGSILGQESLDSAKGFLQSRRTIAVPHLEECHRAVNDMGIYWTATKEEEDM